jgi:MFS family permease
MAVIASTYSPLLAADTLTLSLYFKRKFTSVALLTGYHLLGVGIGGLFFVPSSRIYGKRHAFLIGNILCIIWGAVAGHTKFVSPKYNYQLLIAARFFQGVGLAPYEALVNAVVGDLYFVHERGKRMALTNFCVFGGSFMTPIIVGKMTHSIGWQWTFYFVAIFSGIMLPLIFFFVPEVAFRRNDRFNTDIIVLGSNQLAVQIGAHNKNNGSTELETDQENKESSYDQQASAPTNADPISVEANNPTPPERKTYLQSLALFDGRKTDENFFTLFFRPFPLIAHPAVLWVSFNLSSSVSLLGAETKRYFQAMLIQGTLIGWTVFLGVILAAVLLGPPLFYNEVTTGYMYAGAFVGAIAGFLVSFAVADLVPKLLTQRNKGIYEPEFRLVLVLPMVISASVGLFGFGAAADNVLKYGATVLSVFFGFEVAGMVMGAVASSLYIVDAYRDISIESFTCMMLFKNIFSFALTFKAYDWLVLTGNAKGVFFPVGGVQIAVCLLTIPLCKSATHFCSFVFEYHY